MLKRVCGLFSQSGETQPLDLGAPISSLDGLRVVLDKVETASGKGKTTKTKPPKHDETQMRSIISK